LIQSKGLADVVARHPIADVEIVDARSRRPRRAEPPKKGSAVENPLEKLLGAKTVHSVAKWEGIEVDEAREELVRPWKEEGFDEWDRQLDKGHVRKVRNKRPAPVANPFDHVPEKRSPAAFRKPH
jgi:hypothetical protein